MTSNVTHRFLIAYDVQDDRRRNRLAKLLSAHGDRVQFSVFVVDARPARLTRLRDAMSDVIVAGRDSVLICDLGEARVARETRFAYLGLGRGTTPSDVIIV